MKRPWVIGIFLLAVLSLLVCTWWSGRRKDHARKVWKEEAIHTISAWFGDAGSISNELHALKPLAWNQTNDHDWIGTNVLLMTNGEYLVYKKRHGRQDLIHPILNSFLARGSNGKWLYSTYHFCSEMFMIRGDEPPGSIADFAQTYFAREFDGQSDECLNKTWPTEK